MDIFPQLTSRKKLQNRWHNVKILFQEVQPKQSERYRQLWGARYCPQAIRGRARLSAHGQIRRASYEDSNSKYRSAREGLYK